MNLDLIKDKKELSLILMALDIAGEDRHHLSNSWREGTKEHKYYAILSKNMHKLEVALRKRAGLEPVKTEKVRSVKVSELQKRYQTENQQRGID